MKTIRSLAIATLAIAVAAAPDLAVGGDSPTWKKVVVEDAFRAEGIAIGDVNRDGKNDLLIGDSWYEAPSWKKHDIRKHGDYGDGARGYSEAMCVWADDVNKDGWVDQISIGFPGKPCFWYENPQGKPGLWKERVAWPSACNETPVYLDLFHNGKKVLVMAHQLAGKPNEGQMAWFEPGSDVDAPWTMHPISPKGTPKQQIPGTAQFSHGLGVGDLNADGRDDVICTGGWWEQPEKVTDAPWTFHPGNLGEACADMIVYDVNNDGHRDVITSSAHKFGIWLHQANADTSDSAKKPFTQVDLFPKLVSETHALICLDLDGDGHKDFVTGKRYLSHGRSEPGSNQPPKLFWFKATPDKDKKIHFEPIEIDGDSGIGTQFMVVDYDGDQDLDIVVANKRGVFLFLRENTAKP